MCLRVEEFDFTAVSVGNPHCVIFFDELKEYLIRELGPEIENHPVFPNRTNVQFAQVISPDSVRILIWERGAGYTLASGSSSCAVAAACVKSGLTDRKLRVLMPGGHLDINVGEDWVNHDAWRSGRGFFRNTKRRPALQTEKSLAIDF